VAKSQINAALQHNKLVTTNIGAYDVNIIGLDVPWGYVFINNHLLSGWTYLFIYTWEGGGRVGMVAWKIVLKMECAKNE